MIKNGMRPIHPGEILRVQTAFDLKLAEAEVGAQIMREVPQRESVAV